MVMPAYHNQRQASINTKIGGTQEHTTIDSGVARVPAARGGS